MTHTLSCSIGSLVIARHKKIRDKLLYMSRRTFILAYVRAKPLIHQGRTRSDLEIRQGSDKHKNTMGEVMICGLTPTRTRKSQLYHSWRGRKISRKTSMVSTVTTNRNIFAVCSFSGRNSREGSPSHDLSIESIHIREK